MRELVEKLTIYKGDKYSGAFHLPVDKNACTELRNDKREYCHPNGDPKLSHPTCVEGMSEKELTDLYNAHMTCRNYRALENSSKCFSKMDKGHKNAQRYELTEANHCMELLEKVKATKPPSIKSSVSSSPYPPSQPCLQRPFPIQIAPNVSSTTPIATPLEESDQLDEKEIRRQKRLELKLQKKQSFWRSVINYVLFFIAFCLVSLFLFYVY
jgi:hypothetical protein